MARTCFFLCASLVLIAGLVGATETNKTEAENEESELIEVVEVVTMEAKVTTPTPTTTTTTTTATTTTTTTPAPTEAPKIEMVEQEAPEELPKVEEEIEDESEDESEEETREPPNEWGTYYNALPSEFPDMRDIFDQVWNNYLGGSPETQCRENDADFNRWYKSSKNEDHAILSYYCKTKDVRGYEHLKVSLSKFNVLEYSGSLKTFQIFAGEYGAKMTEDEAKSIRDEILPFLIDQIALQKQDTLKQDEICPDPGSETFAVASEKVENGLYYNQISISCNITVTDSDIASHMTKIEVVVDRDFKVVNEGHPLLIGLESATRNTRYIEEIERLRDEEALKQTDIAPNTLPTAFTSVLSLVMMFAIQRLLL